MHEEFWEQQEKMAWLTPEWIVALAALTALSTVRFDLQHDKNVSQETRLVRCVH